MKMDGTGIGGITSLSQHARNQQVTDMLNKRAAGKLQAEDDSEEIKAKALKLMRSKKPDAEAVLRARNAIVQNDINGSVKEYTFKNAKNLLTDALVASQRAAEFEVLAHDNSIMDEKREVFSQAAGYLNDYYSHAFVSRHLGSTFRYIPEEQTQEIREQIELINAEGIDTRDLSDGFVMDYLGLSNLDQMSASERVEALKGAIDKLASISGGFIEGFSDDDIAQYSVSQLDIEKNYINPEPSSWRITTLGIPSSNSMSVFYILNNLREWTEQGWKQDEQQNWRNAEREAENNGVEGTVVSAAYGYQIKDLDEKV